MLPHGDACLRLLDKGGACGERIAAVSGAHGRGEGAVADLEGAGAMGDGDSDHVEALGDLCGDAGEDVTRRRMGLVVQAHDRASVVVVADIA